MDAERLIDLSRHALARSRAVAEVVAEAGQAQLLAQAVGGQLVAFGPPELSRDARGLAETGGPGDRDGTGAAEVMRAGSRAARLTGIDDPREALIALGALLADVGIALVGVACATDEEGLYWHCVEAMDAADEAGDRVRAMLRRLSAADLAGRDLRRPPGVVGERAGPWDGGPLAGANGPAGPSGDGRVRERSVERGAGGTARSGALPVESERRNGPAVRDGCGHASGAIGQAPARPAPVSPSVSGADSVLRTAARPAPVPPSTAPSRTDGPVSCHVPLPPRAGRRGGPQAPRPRTAGYPDGPSDGAPDHGGAPAVPDTADSAAGSP